MKRILALLLVLAMLLTLTACGKDEESTPTGESTGATNTTESTNDPTDGTQDSTQGTTESTTGGETTETTEPPTTTPPTTTPPTTTTPTTDTSPTTKPNEEATTPMQCSHTYKEATCTEPKVCTKCGLTHGEALQHNWGSAENGYFITCRRCNERYTCSCGYVCNTCSIDFGFCIHYSNHWKTHKDGCPHQYHIEGDGDYHVIRCVYCQGIQLKELHTWTPYEGGGYRCISCQTYTSNPNPSEPWQEEVGVVGVKIDKTSLTLKVGDKDRLTAIVIPSNADYQGVTWASSNSAVVSVSSDGTITAKKAGFATIIVTTEDGGYTASCDVTVSAVYVNGVSLDQTSLTIAVGKSQQLTATISPSNADNKNVTWSSSNSSVAQVSSTGKVTAKGKGSATITVTTVDGNYTATCTITVTEPPLTVSISMGVGYYMGSSGSARGVFAEANASGGSGNYVEYYIKVYYNGQLVAEGAEDEMIVTLANGTYTAEVYVKDSSGNEATASKSFTCQGY